MGLSFIRICGLYDNFMYPNMLASDRNNNAKIDFQLILPYRVCHPHCGQLRMCSFAKVSKAMLPSTHINGLMDPYAAVKQPMIVDDS